MYRYAYNFLLLADENFQYDDEWLNGVSVDICLTLFDENGKEILFDDDDNEQTVYIPNSSPILTNNEGYMYELIDVYFNPTMDNYIDVRIHKEALTKSGYTLKYEVCNYEKEINITDDPIEDFTTSVPIPIDEYERIVEANINKFDNDMNNPANVSSLLIIKS